MENELYRITHVGWNREMDGALGYHGVGYAVVGSGEIYVFAKSLPRVRF